MHREEFRPFLLREADATAHVVPLFPFEPSEGGDQARLPGRIALVGTFAPRKCGIATFTSDVVREFANHNPGIGIDVYALDNPAAAPLVYEGVAQVIEQESAADYLLAARRINESGVDAVWPLRDGWSRCTFEVEGLPEGVVTPRSKERTTWWISSAEMRDLFARLWSERAPQLAPPSASLNVPPRFGASSALAAKGRPKPSARPPAVASAVRRVMAMRCWAMTVSLSPWPAYADISR